MVASFLAALTAGAQPVAIEHVTVVDTAAAKSLADMTVVIDNGRIASVGRSGASPEAAWVIDGRGKYLIPGLWDMHVHLSWTTRSALPVLIANGVTGVRDLGSRLAEIDDWRARIDAGVLAGPRILRVGPILNGKSFNKYQLVPGNADATRGVARALKYVEVDFLKVHRRMERDSYFALLDEAKKLGLDVVGHIPMTVRPEEALDGGQSTIEHVATLFEGTFAKANEGKDFIIAMTRWRLGEGQALMKRFIAHHTAFDPTLYAYSPNNVPEILTRYIARSNRDDEAKRQKRTAEESKGDAAMFNEFKEVVRVANDAGVLLVTGTDIAAFRVPGFSLHDELAILVECGLTPMQALQAATINAATAMKRSADFGAVQPGKVADLVLLDADPTVDIHNTRRIAVVIAAGRIYDRAALDKLLREGEALAAQN